MIPDQAGDLTVEGNQLARLARNAALYVYDENLEKAADLFDRDPHAWAALPLLLQDRSGMYRDARNAHRAAVEAGAIPADEHTPNPAA